MAFFFFDNKIWVRTSTLVSSVKLYLPHSFRVYFQVRHYQIQPEVFEAANDPLRQTLIEIGKNTLEASGEDVKLHSNRVEKM